MPFTRPGSSLEENPYLATSVERALLSTVRLASDHAGESEAATKLAERLVLSRSLGEIEICYAVALLSERVLDLERRLEAQASLGAN